MGLVKQLHEGGTERAWFKPEATKTRRGLPQASPWSPYRGGKMGGKRKVAGALAGAQSGATIKGKKKRACFS